MTALENWLPGDDLFLWGINLLVQITLISMAALVVAACVRSRPALKWGILCAGLILVLISPLTVLIAQSMGIGLVSVSRESEPAAASPPVVQSIDADMAFQPQGEVVAIASDPELSTTPERAGYGNSAMETTLRSQFETGTNADPIGAVSDSIKPSAETEVAETVRRSLTCLFAVWCCGALLYLIRLLRAWWKLEAIRRTARPITAHGIAGVLHQVCSDLRINCAPRVAASTRVGSPIAVGVRRPEVILPEGLMNELSPAELRSVLTHEFAHIARHDLLVVFCQNLAVSLFWLHPLVHVLSRQLALAREEVCDNHVLGTIDAPSYSRVLLRLAELIQVHDPQLTSVSLLPGEWKLESRIAGILSEGRSKMTCLTRRSRSLVLVLYVSVAIIGTTATLTFSDGIEPVTANPEEAATAAAQEIDPEQPAGVSGATEFQFSGQVVTPDGRPFAGARIYLATRGARQLAMTDGEGRFEFTRTKSRLPNRAQWGVNRLVAVADGYGPAWLKAIIFDTSGNARRDWESRNPNRQFPRVWEQTERVLTLVEDDVPIQGRLVDLEGRPAGGVTIQPRFIGQVYARYAFDELTTDANGEFEVHGVGRDRTVRLVAKGEHTAFSVFFARTTRGETITRSSRPIEEEPDFPGATRNVRVIYSATPVHAVAPSVPVEGTVTNVDTGAPIAGVTIYAYGLENNPEVGRREEFNVITDERGQFRMTGLPIGFNSLLAVGDGSEPYLPANVIARTNDEQSLLKLDFSLKQGVWLEGRVTDAHSGEPVRATIDYSALNDNPYLAQAPGFELAVSGSLCRTNQSGNYRLPVLPGPGIVAVNALDSRRYPTGIMSERLAAEYPGNSTLLMTRPAAIFPLGFNFLASVDPADATESEELNIQLQAAPAIAVRLVDPDGQPLSGVSMNDYTQSNGFTISDSSDLTSDVYRVRNYLGTQPRRLVAWHPERNLAGQLVIRERPDGDLTFQLQPAGTIRGRVVHDDGRPRPVRFIRSLVDAAPELDSGVLAGTAEMLSTNADGEFEFQWIVPGLTYNLPATHPTAGNFLGVLLDDVTLEAGETRDLGDVQIQRDTP